MNRYHDEMIKLAVKISVGRWTGGLLERATAAEPVLPAAGSVANPGVMGSVLDAGVRSVKGAAQGVGNAVTTLAGGGVNKVLMAHASLKYNNPSLTLKFEKGLRGMTDAEKLQYAHDNLGPAAVKDAQAAMNMRATSRAGTAAAVAVGATSAMSSRNQEQYQ